MAEKTFKETIKVTADQLVECVKKLLHQGNVRRVIIKQGERTVAEFRVSEDNLIDVGAEITADHFVPGQKVDITGVTVGKGFQGAMKRWNFGGMRATHGVSVSHRAHGSTGQRQDPGRTFKGKKMAGHLGQETVTTLNLTVWRVDVERGLILVKGAVPGTEGDFVKIRDAVKVAAPKGVPTPGAFRKAGQEAAPAAEDETAVVETAAETPAAETPVEAAGQEAPVEAAATPETAVEETTAPDAAAAPDAPEAEGEAQ